MPFDLHFQSKPKAKLKLLEPESVEMQLGRSDHRLGSGQSKNPFPEDGTDASEWSRGWLAERSIEINNRERDELRYAKFRRCPR